MRNAYSPIDRLAGELTRPKGTGAEFMTELSKKPGYKQAEVEDRDLQTLTALPKMAREEFLRALKAKRAFKPYEKVLSGSSEGLSRAEEYERRMSGQTDNDTHHEEWTLPGGRNYREILLKHPDNVGYEGPGGHFGDEPDILASIRVKDRTGPNGEKILHIEEIQSDWHQTGREKGYLPKNHQELIDAAYKKSREAGFAHSKIKSQLDASKEWSNILNKRLTDQYDGTFKLGMPRHEETKEGLRFHNNKIMELMPQVMKADQARLDAESDYHRMMSQSGVPDAPYKKNWHELALKRMIQHAAEKGYDSIAVTPGEEQAKRYKLSKHVGMVSYNPDEKHFQAFKPNRETVVNEKGASPERVADLIGKDATARLMAAPAQMGHHFLEGEDLNVGGEGMKGFYDKMVPKFLNQFGKKYGAQVGQVQIPGDPSQRGDASEALGLAHVNLAGMAPQEVAAFNQKLDAHNAKTLHSFPITPEMREDVTKNGIPLYKSGGEVEVRPTTKDETIQRRIPEMEAAAKALQSGVIDRKEYDRVVKKHKPVKPYDFIPQPASDEDADRALMENKKPQWRGHSKWPAGRKVGLRLDIPAYENHGVWVNSIHDEEGKGEDKFKTSYAPVSSVKNATFDAGPEKAVKVATGEDRKSPFARIKGELHHMTEDEAVEHIKEHLNNPEYAQVGMDPRRHGFFYDRKTMKPVTHSEHVVQIGPLVLAKNPKYGKREAYADGGRVHKGLPDFLASSVEKRKFYHGTQKDFGEFKNSPNGVFLTLDPEIANEFAEGWNKSDDEYKNDSYEGANVLPVHAQIKDPFDYENAEHRARLRKAAQEVHGSDKMHRYIEDLNGKFKNHNWERMEESSMMRPLKHAGFDSYYVSENGRKNLAVFDPKKVKSAIGNRGTYDTREADITKAKGGAVKPTVRGIIKERVTVSPDKDVMMYELMSAKRFTKKVK
jgi:hypothetical protein